MICAVPGVDFAALIVGLPNGITKCLCVQILHFKDEKALTVPFGTIIVDSWWRTYKCSRCPTGFIFSRQHRSRDRTQSTVCREGYGRANTQ